MKTSCRSLSMVAAVLMMFVAVPASGQAWRGVPLDSLTTGVGLLAGFPDGYDTYGAEAFKGFGMFTLGLEYGLATFGDGIPSMHTGRLNVAVPAPLGFENMGLFVAPVASAAYLSQDGESAIQIPVGVSVMYRANLGQGLAVVPYAIPQYFWMRWKEDGTSGSETETDTEFGWRVGGNLVVNNLIFGGSYGKVGSGEGVKGVASINVGFLMR